MQTKNNQSDDSAPTPDLFLFEMPPIPPFHVPVDTQKPVNMRHVVPCGGSAEDPDGGGGNCFAAADVADNLTFLFLRPADRLQSAPLTMDFRANTLEDNEDDNEAHRDELSLTPPPDLHLNPYDENFTVEIRESVALLDLPAPQTWSGFEDIDDDLFDDAPNLDV